MVEMLRRLSELPYFAGEYVAIRLTPKKGPGPLTRFFFRAPLLIYKLGFGRLIGNQVLLLTTIGHKSGKKRVVSLAYTCDPKTGIYFVSAGWAGRSNWYRNARLHSHVKVKVGAYEFDAIAEPVSEGQTMRLFEDYSQRNPFAQQLYSQILGRPFDGTKESWKQVAAHFPTLALRPQSYR